MIVPPQAPVAPSDTIREIRPEAPIAALDDEADNHSFPWGWVVFGIGMVMVFFSVTILGVAFAWVYWNLHRNDTNKPKRGVSYL